jgi:hypothetical protein
MRRPPVTLANLFGGVKRIWSITEYLGGGEVCRRSEGLTSPNGGITAPLRQAAPLAIFERARRRTRVHATMIVGLHEAA